MAERPTLNLIDNPLAVGERAPVAAVPTARENDAPEAASSPASASPSRPRATGGTRRPRQGAAGGTRKRAANAKAPDGCNPYARMRKVQAPVRLFPPLWERLERLVEELRDEDLEADKTALLNAVLHFQGPQDAREARELLLRWRALLASPPPPRG